MLLSEYLVALTETINEFTMTGLIVSSSVTADYRTEKIGQVEGALFFVDGSRLFFRGKL